MIPTTLPTDIPPAGLAFAGQTLRGAKATTLTALRLQAPAGLALAGQCGRGAAAAGVTAAGLGIAGDNSRGTTAGVAAALRPPPRSRGTLGDQARPRAAEVARHFATWTDLVKPAPGGGVTWCVGAAERFALPHRRIALGVDSGGYSRLDPRRNVSTLVARCRTLSGSHCPDPAPAVCRLGLSGGPGSEPGRPGRPGSRLAQADIPNGRLWPVWSVSWAAPAELRWNGDWGRTRPPIWDRADLAGLVPPTRTDRRWAPATLTAWARQALALAAATAADPTFRALVARYGRVMIGGLCGSGLVRRPVRALFFAALLAFFPDLHLWGLGQASHVVINCDLPLCISVIVLQFCSKSLSTLC